MRFVRFVQQLSPFAGRTAGSEAERYCQETLAGICLRAGATAKVQGLVCPQPTSAVLSLHAGVLLTLLPLGVFFPGVALFGALLLTISLIADGNGRSPLRWFMYKGMSSNMVARFPRKAPILRVVVTAHADVARVAPIPFRLPFTASGLVKSGRIYALWIPVVIAGWQSVLHFFAWLGFFEGFFTNLLWLQAGLDAGLLVFAQAWLRGPAAGGASDNGSGLAVLAAIAERWGEAGPQDTELWLIAGGAGEISAGGTRSALHRYRPGLPTDATVVIDVDEVGRGRPTLVSGVRRFDVHRYRPELIATARELMRADKRFGDREPVTLFGWSDGHAAAVLGYPSVTITCLEDGDSTGHRHSRTDRSDALDPRSMREAYDLCWLLIDAERERRGGQAVPRDPEVQA